MVRLEAVRRSPRVILALVTLAVFTDILMYDLVVPFLPEHLRDQDVSETGIGLLFGCYSVALLVATPIVGGLSERVGRRRMVLLGALGLIGTAVLYAVATDCPVLFAARILQGSASAAVWVPGLALLADVYPSDTRGQAMGTAMGGMCLGALLGPPLGGFLFDWGGYQAPFVAVIALAAGVGTALWLFLGDPVPSRQKTLSLAAQLKDWHILVTAGAVVIGYGVLSLLEPTLPIDLADRLQIGPTTIGLLFASATIAYGLSAPVAGWCSDRWGRKWTMTAGLVATLLLLPLAALPGTWFGEACALIPLGMACAFLLSPTLPELADCVDRRGTSAYGVAYAVFNTANAVGMLIGPVLGGVLTTQLGFPLALAVVSLAGLAYLPFLLVTRGGHAPLEQLPQSRAA